MPIMGSPPLAREPLYNVVFPDVDRRITPARAGTTTTAKALVPTARDHPRSRGNHFRPGSNFFLERGSPPLAREPPERTIKVGFQLRITPARAGTTAGWTLQE